MGARRRAGPAAIAAAVLGAGLALYRPRLVPELSPGPRAHARPAAAVDWTAAEELAAAAAADANASVERAVMTEEISAWRDAPADRPFSAAERAVALAGAALRAAPSSGRSERREPREAQAGADSEENSLHAAVIRLIRAASRRAKRAPVPSQPRHQDAASARNARRRIPLAQGPAGPDDVAGEDGAASLDSRSSGQRGGAAWTRRSTRFFPLFRPPRRGGARPANSAARRRVRPLLLSKLLGRGALRPPPASLVPPDLSRLRERKPARLPDGSPVPSHPYELDRIEAHDPRRANSADRRRAPHWDEGPRWHDGPAHGVIADARWLWLWKEKARWWAVGEPEQGPLLRHRELWWGKQRGVWFALHGGELWSWRRFSDWDAEGLIRLTDGVELVYSSDFTKVAVITPGAGAVLYDAYSGAELGEWLESEMPRRRPRAPTGLRLPRGI